MPVATPTAPPIISCRFCGAEIPADADHCPSCGKLLAVRSTRITLAITLLFIIAGFALTQYFVSLHRGTDLSLANRWFTRGEAAMKAGMPMFAAEAYRTALNYDQDNWEYRLRLAQALLAANRLAEARAHLLSLWDEEPSNGEVNLALARLNARRGNFREAVRSYNNAINGVWDETPRKHRTAVRFELASYLLQKRQLAEAQADLLALVADTPPDPADQLLLGQMLLQVNEPEHAVPTFAALVAKDDHNAQAWLGQGEAYLALADYRNAERSLAKAVERDPNLPEARQQLELAREVLQIDPALRGLTLAERAARVAKAFSTAMTRLSACAMEQHVDLSLLEGGVSPADSTGARQSTNVNEPASAPNELQLLYTSGLQKQAAATERALRKDPDAMEPAMQYVFHVEKSAALVCPEMGITDRALLLLADRQGEALR